MNKRLKLSIVMPVLNEGANLKITLKILNALISLPHEVIVVYDEPNDNSIPVVRSMQKTFPGLRSIHNKLGRGVINAIKSGVKAAIGEYVLIMPADDIGPLFIVDKMVNLMEKGYDMVNTTRYAYNGGIWGGVFISRFLSKLANKSFCFLTQSSLTDLTMGIKMFRKSKFDQISFESKPVGWAFAFEFSIKAQLAGWKISEIPITSLNRFYAGRSSFKLNRWAPEYIKWFFWGLKEFYINGRRTKR